MTIDQNRNAKINPEVLLADQAENPSLYKVVSMTRLKIKGTRPRNANKWRLYLPLLSSQRVPVYPFLRPHPPQEASQLLIFR